MSPNQKRLETLPSQPKKQLRPQQRIQPLFWIDPVTLRTLRRTQAFRLLRPQQPP